MTINPVDLVACVALALRFVRESPPGSNRGDGVEAMLKACGLGPGHPWCAAFVSYVGRVAFGPRWPLPMTAGCVALSEAAAQRGLVQPTPEPGDVFLLYYPKLSRFAHTGFVLDVRADGTCDTIEGNTNDGGSREGWGVFTRTRRFGARDRFIRWTGNV